jgi:hypothetical protein
MLPLVFFPIFPFGYRFVRALNKNNAVALVLLHLAKDDEQAIYVPRPPVDYVPDLAVLLRKPPVCRSS